MPFSSYHDPAEDSPKIRPDYVIKLFNDSETSTDQVKAAHVTSLTKSKRRLIQKVTFIRCTLKVKNGLLCLKCSLYNLVSAPAA